MHPFVAKIQDDTKEHFDVTPRCMYCNRYEIDHTDSAQCESCPAIGKMELVDGLLLCEACAARDKQIKAELLASKDSNNPQHAVEARIAALNNELSKEIPIDAKQYFVSRLTSIVDIEKQFLEATNNDAERARFLTAIEVEKRTAQLKETFFGKKREWLDYELTSKTQLVADQLYLNKIVPQLREQERERFKEYDITYKPVSVKPVSTEPKKPRMSASDRALESAAALIGIPLEQYKKIIQNTTKNVLSVECTCAATPGMCKIHIK